jgi:hypothetical protein
MGVIAGGKCQDLQRQIDAKRDAWCKDCGCQEQLQNVRDELARTKKSNAALGGVVNAQVYEIKRLKLCLRRANIDAGETYFNAVARG